MRWVMILVVSDLHLGYKKSNHEDFLNFLNEYENVKIDHLILLGDIFDFWRCRSKKIITENEEILSKLSTLTHKIHYIAGNHDYYILNLKGIFNGNYPFKVSKYLRLDDHGEKFYFMHGYELEVLFTLDPLTIDLYEKFSEKMCLTENIIGGIAGFLWDFLEISRRSVDRVTEEMKKNPQNRRKICKVYELAVSQGRYPLLGLKPDEKLVFGHTHRPFINNDKTVVNTGSWVDELPSKEYHNSYVEISKGEIKLKFFK
jgi:UDP-2,3-diacylglucosamine pyrophosphatase LpxH